MTFAIEPGPVHEAFDRACLRLEESRFSHALWTRCGDVWSTDPGVQRKIANRLGWVDAPRTMQADVLRLRRTAAGVRDAGFTDVVLAGMGGSSLAAEVLRAVIGVQPGFPSFQVLDSVDPDAVRSALERAATTLFVLASKSGSTIELASITAGALDRLRAAGVVHHGAHFVAITDEGTQLHRRAVAEQFREAFINPPDIGGRFSAISLFGLVPAALMGIDVEKLLESAAAMSDQCRLDNPRENPGLALGALLGAAATSGRDKLILALPPTLERFGLWAEQLVAESTGKDGKGIVPILADGAGPTRGDDRVVVAATIGNSASVLTTSLPIANIHVPDVIALGAEFVRWEWATAAAGWLLGVNPFDEPNVQQAKEATRALLEVYGRQRRLPVGEPHARIEGTRITVSAAARAGLPDGVAGALSDLARPGDYVALLAYLPPDDPRFMPVLLAARRSIAASTGCVVSLGFGPRYLHSTGQLHKGGPNTGVFLIVTADPASDLPVPGEPYSFGVLEMAQALGDFQSLDRLSRRAVHIHLPHRDPALLDRVLAQIGVRSR